MKRLLILFLILPAIFVRAADPTPDDLRKAGVTPAQDITGRLNKPVLVPKGVDPKSAAVRARVRETQRIDLQSIRFQEDSVALADDASRLQLAELAKSLLCPELRTATVTLEGHTCNKGTASYNEGLSLRRAKEVRRLLVAAGIDESRIAVAGRGLAEPVAGTVEAQTESQRQQNRRVRIIRES